MKKILDMVNENAQDGLKKFQDAKNKEHEKTQKQKNELRGYLNKHQSKTEDIMEREINELKMKIKNINEEVTIHIKNLRKKESNRNTKHNRRPLQQTKTNGRHNLRT
jgi:hypothetical protein